MLNSSSPSKVRCFGLRTASGCFHFQAGVAMNILFKLDLDRLNMPNFLSVLLNRTPASHFCGAPAAVADRQIVLQFVLTGSRSLTNQEN